MPIERDSAEAVCAASFDDADRAASFDHSAHAASSDHSARAARSDRSGDADALVVKRNCSMSPRAVIALLTVTAAVSFGIGAVFAWHGLWLVLPFVGIEIAALVAAFYVNGLHAGDYERFAFSGDRLTFEVREGRRIERHDLHAHWVRLVLRHGRRDCSIALASHGRELPIGRHLDGAGRGLLARELERRLALARARTGFGAA